MTLSRFGKWAIVVAAVLVMNGPSLAGRQNAQGFVRVSPEEIRWVDVEGGLGAQTAVLEGDPAKPGKTGAYMKHPARGPHFDGAKDEEVILQIVGRGPVDSPRIRPQDGGYGYKVKR